MIIVSLAALSLMSLKHPVAPQAQQDAAVLAKEAETRGRAIFDAMKKAAKAPSENEKRLLAVGLVNEVFTYAETYAKVGAEKYTIPTGVAYTRALANELLATPEKFDLDAGTRAKMYADIQKSSCQYLADIGKYESRVNEYRSKPLELQFKAMDGAQIDLAKFRGKPVMVEFSAITWCAPCAMLRPILKELNDKYKDQGLVLLTILYDPLGDEDRVAKVLEREGCNWPHWLTGDRKGPEFAKNLGINAVPRTMFLDKKGILVCQRLGWTETIQDDMEAIIKKLL